MNTFRIEMSISEIELLLHCLGNYQALSETEHEKTEVKLLVLELKRCYEQARRLKQGYEGEIHVKEK